MITKRTGAVQSCDSVDAATGRLASARRGSAGWSKERLGALLAAVALVLVVAAGCSAHPEEDLERTTQRLESDAGDADAPDSGCEVVRLVGTKRYNPSRWTDDARTLGRSTTFELPTEARILDGNAGNHWVTLTYSVGGGAPLSCRYRGGSSQSHPSGATQIALGMRYVFQSCTSGAVAGDSVVADQVTLHVDNGDSYKDPTTVELTLNERAPCGSDAGSEAGPTDGGSSAEDGGVACTPADCADRLPCQIGTCTPSGCSYVPAANGTLCEDGNACTIGDECLAGTCTAGAPVDLTSEPCVVKSCDPVLGVSTSPAAAGTPCPNTTVCDGQEQCAEGICQPGVPLVVPSATACMTFTCDPVSGIVGTPQPAGTSCSVDNNVCNGVEACSAAGACVTGPLPNLDDGNPCTTDDCSPITGPSRASAIPRARCGAPSTVVSIFSTRPTRASLTTTASVASSSSASERVRSTSRSRTRTRGATASIASRTPSRKTGSSPTRATSSPRSAIRPAA